MIISVKRVYEDCSEDDGYRILVERLWPRGISKDRAHVDLWMKDLAPSTELRKRFGHLDERWEEFKRDYANELGENPAVGDLIEIIGNRGRVTLVYSAKNRDHNSAVFLREYLLKKIESL